MDPALICFWSPVRKSEMHHKYHLRLPNVPQTQTISKFLGPKKNWAGGVLGEGGLGTYTSPTLRI